jgi:hypothetical protein
MNTLRLLLSRYSHSLISVDVRRGFCISVQTVVYPSNDGCSLQGAPVEVAAIGPPVAYPKAATDFLHTFQALMADKALANLADKEVPMRLTFLTPGSFPPIVLLISFVLFC